MAASYARRVAARALLAVEQGQGADDAVAAEADAVRLTPEDRGLAWFLVLGVLRHRGQVDAALAERLSRPLFKVEPGVRAVLRVGAFERLFGRAPPHAIVHEAVEASRALGVGRASGMVNAVLRRVSMPERLDRADALDHPAWLVSRWDARYGREAVDRWCHANRELPVLTVVARDEAAYAGLLADPALGAEPAEFDGGVVPGVLHLRSARGAVDRLPGFTEGAFWVMDLASVLVADMVGGGRVLDACAAPGGKTLRMATRGAAVVASDRSEQRLRDLRGGCTRVGAAVEAIEVVDWMAEDGARLGLFDAVLVDAPCTGLGTVRRHPEIRWRRRPGDLVASATRQVVIATRAAARVKPGGALVYAVCSPEPEEGPEVVARLVERTGMTIEAVLDTAPPGPDHDAFYAARLRSAR